jgi:hypothetical protein
MQATANPVFANVAFLRVPDFDALSVGEQASLKEKLESRARAALGALPRDARVVLDTEDGLALVMFGDPAQALAIVQAVHAQSQQNAVQAGLSYGPLALTSRGSDARVFGDGLAAAAAAARFAEPGKLLVTQDFAKALEHRNPERAAELASAGDFTDTRVRQHSFFAPDPRRGAMHRRRMAAFAVIGVAAIVALGIAGREARLIFFPPPPAVVSLAVKPRGEVFVDGISKGRVPALKEVEVPAGRHVFQVKSPGVPTYEITLDLKAGERRTLTHTFPRLPEPRKPPPEPDFWRDLKKKFS